MKLKILVKFRNQNCILPPKKSCSAHIGQVIWCVCVSMHTAYASWREIYYNIPGNEQWPHKCKLNYTCTTSIPFITLAKTVCLLSSQGVATVVIKNWDPLVFGPAFAIDTVKGLSCRKLQKYTNDSSNVTST